MASRCVTPLRWARRHRTFDLTEYLKRCLNQKLTSASSSSRLNLSRYFFFRTPMSRLFPELSSDEEVVVLAESNADVDNVSGFKECCSDWESDGNCCKRVQLV